MNWIKKWLRKREIRREMEKLENKHKDLWFNSDITVKEFIIRRNSMLLQIKELERELNELD